MPLTSPSAPGDPSISDGAGFGGFETRRPLTSSLIAIERSPPPSPWHDFLANFARETRLVRHRLDAWLDSFGPHITNMNGWNPPACVEVVVEGEIGVTRCIEIGCETTGSFADAHAHRSSARHDA